MNTKKGGTNNSISIQHAGELLGVSPATVRNWIKLGKLSSPLLESDIRALRDSLDSNDLLKSRRNKSRLRTNYIPRSYISTASPNYRIVASLISDGITDISSALHFFADNLMNKAGIPVDIRKKLLSGFTYSQEDATFFSDYNAHLIEGEDFLGMLYISHRGLQDKKKTGSYYTPFFVADTLISQSLQSYRASRLATIKIADPACGTGNFLLRLPKEIPLENIYGFDIDPLAVNITRINLAIKYQIKTLQELNIINNNVKCMDFLLAQPDNSLKADLYIGNPPWGYSYDKAYIKSLRKNFTTIQGNKKPESFALFIEKALSYGDVSFLLPETILGSDAYYPIRSHICKKSIVNGICYLDEVFDKVQCPCVILHIHKDSEKNGKVNISFYRKKKFSVTLLKEFDISGKRITPDSFVALTDDSSHKIIQKMNNCSHFTLEGNADFALGIVTGSNRTKVSVSPREGYEPIIKGSDIQKYAVKKPANYVVFAPERFQQVADESFYRSKPKLFYKFISKEPVFALDETGLLSLNSANILIPRIEGYSEYYILAVLNSSAIRFYYSATFKNLKVLRSAIEALPIPKCSASEMEAVSALSRDLHHMVSSGQEADEQLVKRLDKMVAKLYNLDTDDLANI